MPVDDTNAPKNRRLALKALGGSAIIGGLTDKLPGAWQRPLISSAVLPAHAQSSPDSGPALVLRVVEGGRELPSLVVPYVVEMRAGEPSGITLYPGSVETMSLQSLAKQHAKEQASNLADALLPAAHAQAAPQVRTTERNPIFIPASGQTFLQLADGPTGDAYPNTSTCNFLIRVQPNARQSPPLNIFGGYGTGARGEGVACGDFMIYPGQSPSGNSFINGYPILTEAPPGVGVLPPTTLPAALRPTIQWTQTAQSVNESFGRDMPAGAGRFTVSMDIQRPATIPADTPLAEVLREAVFVEVSETSTASYGTSLTNTGGAGIDFSLPGGRVANQPANVTAVQPAQAIREGLVGVIYADTDVNEGDETIILTLQERDGIYFVGQQSVITVTIINDMSVPVTTRRISLVVMDTANNQMATVSLDYNIDRNDATNRIDTITFPAADAQMVAHQPLEKVLAALFPTAHAQVDGTLALATEVVLTFTDDERVQTANLSLTYEGAACDSVFAVTVSLYPGRQGIQSVTGGQTLSCGSFTVEADTGAGSGFGTFPPPPPPSVTPDGAREFRWIWEWAGYSVQGRLVAVGGVDPIMQQGDTHTGIFLHTYQVSQGGSLQYTIDLVTGTLTTIAGTSASLAAMRDAAYTYTLGDSGFTLTGGFDASLTFTAGPTGLVLGANGWQLYDENGTSIATAPAYAVPVIAEGEDVPVFVVPATTGPEVARTHWWHWEGLDPADNFTVWTLIGRFGSVARDGDVVTHESAIRHTYTAYRNGNEVFTYDLSAEQDHIMPADIVQNPSGESVEYYFRYIVGTEEFDTSMPPVLVDKDTGEETESVIALGFYYAQNGGIGLEYRTADDQLNPNRWVFDFSREMDGGRNQAARSDTGPVVSLDPPPIPAIIPATLMPLPVRHYWWRWEQGNFVAIGTFTSRNTGRIRDNEVDSHEFTVYNAGVEVYTLDLTGVVLTPEPDDGPIARVTQDFVYYAGEDTFQLVNEAPDTPFRGPFLLAASDAFGVATAGLIFDNRETSTSPGWTLTDHNGNELVRNSDTSLPLPQVFPYQILPPPVGTGMHPPMTSSMTVPSVGWALAQTGISRPEPVAGGDTLRNNVLANTTQVLLELNFSPESGRKTVYFRILTDRSVQGSVGTTSASDGRFSSYEEGDDYGLIDVMAVNDQLYSTDANGTNPTFLIFRDFDPEPEEVVQIVLDLDPNDPGAYTIDNDNRILTITIQDTALPQGVYWERTLYTVDEPPAGSAPTGVGVPGTDYNAVTVTLTRESGRDNAEVMFRVTGGLSDTFSHEYTAASPTDFVLHGAQPVDGQSDTFRLPGNTSTIEVRVYRDMDQETEQVISLTLAEGTGYLITGSPTTQIFATDPAVAGATTAAPAATLSFNVSRSRGVTDLIRNDAGELVEMVISYDFNQTYTDDTTDGSGNVTEGTRPQFAIDLGDPLPSTADLPSFAIGVRLDDMGDGGAGTRESNSPVNIDTADAGLLGMEFGERVLPGGANWQRYITFNLTGLAAARFDLADLPITRLITLAPDSTYAIGSPSRVRLEFFDSSGDYRWYWQFGNYRIAGRLISRRVVPDGGTITEASRNTLTRHDYEVYDRAAQSVIYTVDLLTGLYNSSSMSGTGEFTNVDYSYTVGRNSFDTTDGFSVALTDNGTSIGLSYDATAAAWTLYGVSGETLITAPDYLDAQAPLVQAAALPAPFQFATTARVFRYIWEVTEPDPDPDDSSTRAMDYRLEGTMVIPEGVDEVKAEFAPPAAGSFIAHFFQVYEIGIGRTFVFAVNLLTGDIIEPDGSGGITSRRGTFGTAEYIYTVGDDRIRTVFGTPRIGLFVAATNSAGQRNRSYGIETAFRNQTELWNGNRLAGHPQSFDVLPFVQEGAELPQWIGLTTAPPSIFVWSLDTGNATTAGRFQIVVTLIASPQLSEDRRFLSEEISGSRNVTDRDISSVTMEAYDYTGGTQGMELRSTTDPSNRWYEYTAGQLLFARGFNTVADEVSGGPPFSVYFAHRDSDGDLEDGGFSIGYDPAEDHWRIEGLVTTAGTAVDQFDVPGFLAGRFISGPDYLELAMPVPDTQRWFSWEWRSDGNNDINTYVVRGEFRTSTLTGTIREGDVQYHKVVVNHGGVVTRLFTIDLIAGGRPDANAGAGSRAITDPPTGTTYLVNHDFEFTLPTNPNAIGPYQFGANSGAERASGNFSINFTVQTTVGQTTHIYGLRADTSATANWSVFTGSDSHAATNTSVPQITPKINQ